MVLLLSTILVMVLVFGLEVLVALMTQEEQIKLLQLLLLLLVTQ
jgi:hypothetical protein